MGNFRFSSLWGGKRDPRHPGAIIGMVLATVGVVVLIVVGAPWWLLVALGLAGAPLLDKGLRRAFPDRSART
jgi:hypothetical protein